MAYPKREEKKMSVLRNHIAMAMEAYNWSPLTFRHCVLTGWNARVLAMGIIAEGA